MPDRAPAADPALLQRAASIEHLRVLARRRLPRYVWTYLDSGCADNHGTRANRAALDAVQLQPQYLRAGEPIDTRTSLFGRDYRAPIGVAPLGLSGLLWPDCSLHQAMAADALGLPFVLSTMATSAIEEVAAASSQPIWFQLYPPADAHIRDDLLARAKAAGVETLVVTIDVPAPGRRPDDMRNGLAVPPRISPRSVFESALCPHWSLATLRAGLPEFANLKPYLRQGNLQRTAAEIRFALRQPVDDAVVADLRRRWSGALVIKGVIGVEDAQRAVELGADGLIVSNHGGRQLDAAPASAAALARICDALGERCTVMADGGVQSGTDVARLLALGARAVFAGRASAVGPAALGPPGARHALAILCDELDQVLIQLRCARPGDLRQFLAA